MSLKPQKIFFSGIGGSGMSAIACFMADKGHMVVGSDRAAVGWENPRTDYEAPADRMTLAVRQRQLHDEDKSCVSNPRISE
jgi:UDP-N-acetylmuramate-alanine ligase